MITLDESDIFKGAGVVRNTVPFVFVLADSRTAGAKDHTADVFVYEAERLGVGGSTVGDERSAEDVPVFETGADEWVRQDGRVVGGVG